MPCAHTHPPPAHVPGKADAQNRMPTHRQPLHRQAGPFQRVRDDQICAGPVAGVPGRELSDRRQARLPGNSALCSAILVMGSRKQPQPSGHSHHTEMACSSSTLCTPHSPGAPPPRRGTRRHPGRPCLPVTPCAAPVANGRCAQKIETRCDHSTASNAGAGRRRACNRGDRISKTTKAQGGRPAPGGGECREGSRGVVMVLPRAMRRNEQPQFPATHARHMHAL